MKILLVLFISLSLHASIKQDMLNLYQKKEYEKVCKIGFNNFTKNRKDEDYISLYAFSCLNADYIDRLSVPIVMLKYSKESRANSAYFSVILMQKKLLYHALVDDYDLSSLKLPSTEYVLSKVFDLYAELGKHDKKPFYIFSDKDDAKKTYKLYLENKEKINMIVIEEYYDAVVVQRHTYW